MSDAELKWIPVSAAAAELAVSRQRVHRLIQSGLLASRRVNNTVLVGAHSVADRRAQLVLKFGKRG